MFKKGDSVVILQHSKCKTEFWGQTGEVQKVKGFIDVYVHGWGICAFKPNEIVKTR